MVCAGRQETGTKIAEFCSHALLTLEVLIHPRSLPLIDFQSPTDHYDDVGIKFPETMYSIGHRQRTTFPVGTAGKKGPGEGGSNEDDLYRSWLGNGDTMEDPVTNLQGKVRNAEETLGASSKHPSSEKVTNDFPSGTSNHELSNLEPSVVDATMQISADRGEIMVEFQKHEMDKQFEEHEGGNPVSPVSTHASTVSNQLVSGNVTLEPKDPVSTSGKDVSMAEGEAMNAVDHIPPAPTSVKDVETSHSYGYNMIIERISASVSNTSSKKAIVQEMDDNSSVESLPDIVDGDPDSDCD